MLYHHEHPDVGCTLTRRITFLEPGSKMPRWLSEELLNENDVGFFPSTLVARRDVFTQVGLYNTSYKTGESADWFARAKDAGILIEILPDILLHKRVHESNLSHHIDDTRTNMLKILRASIDRKRVQASDCPES